MAGRLKGKVAVVTAAGQGIGRAIAEAFVAEGATVWATDKDVGLLEGIPKAKKRKLDVLSSKAVNAFAEKVGPVDILVNAAGFVRWYDWALSAVIGIALWASMLAKTMRLRKAARAEAKAGG